MQFQEATTGILPYKLSTTGEHFCSFRELDMGFFATKCAPQAKKMWFQGATKEILRYKICAAGENSAVSERYKDYFTLQNERHRRFFQFQGAKKRILR